jgi:DNA-binding PadR family transcriptional regulator
MFAGVHAGAHRYLCHARGYPGHGHGRHSGDSMEHEMLARRRKFGAQELQLLFLALLAEKPCHGYELIKDIEQRSRGYYVPSPGVVYPALTFLEETGLVEVEADGNRKLYRVSTLGVAHLESAREEVKLTLARLSFVGKKMETMRRAMQGEGGEPDPDGWLPEYIAAHRGLKRALVLKADADEAEQRRIAAILQRAIAEIEGTGNE